MRKKRVVYKLIKLNIAHMIIYENYGGIDGLFIYMTVYIGRNS